MVMEFVRGETLDDLIRRSGAMPVDRAIGLLCQALEGIDHAHRMGIIHRDVKPANMMMTESGTLKVMDFGIARVLGTSRMTKQGNIVGTIEYMSPEQVRGQDTDARSDIYSLGILLYEMVTGRVPFTSDSEFDLMKMQIDEAPPPPRVFSAQVPQAVEQAIMRALAKRPDARFQSAADFRDALLSARGMAAAPSISAVTSPPATRLGEAVTAPSSFPGPTAKETRLGTDASTGFQADQLKATRLGGDASAAYGAGPGVNYQQAAPPAGKSAAKLFIGIAVAAVLAAIAGISVVLMSGARTPNAPSSPAVTQPAQPAPPQAPAAAGAGQPSIPQQPPPPPLESQKPTAGGLDGASYAAGESTAAAKTAKTVRKESDAEAAARKEKARKAAEARRLLNQ